MDIFSVKGSGKWGDSTEEKQLHSSLFEVSSKNERKSKSSEQQQTAQVSKKKPRKRKNSAKSDNFTSIKNLKKTDPHQRHLVIPVPVKDATTKEQHDIEDQSQIYPQSRENSPPPKKKKRRRKDSVGSDAGTAASKDHVKSKGKKNRNRRNSQEDEHDVTKTTHKQRKRTTSVSSIGSDASLGSPKARAKQPEDKLLKKNKGDTKHEGDKSVTAQTTNADKDGEGEEEPKKRKRKRKPRNNKFKKLEGSVKSENTKVSQSPIEQRPKVSEMSAVKSQRSHLPTELRTNGSALVSKELKTKQKRKLSSKIDDSSGVEKKQAKQSQIANNFSVNRTSPTKDPTNRKTHTDPSHTKEKYSSQMKVLHREKSSPEKDEETDDQEKGSKRKKKRDRKRNNKTELLHTKVVNSSVEKMFNKDEAFPQKDTEIGDQENGSTRKKRRARKRHNEKELCQNEVENSSIVETLHKEERDDSSQKESGDQKEGNAKQKKRSHKRSNKGRKKETQIVQPKSTTTKVKPEKEEVHDESESEKEGEKVLESVVQSEGLLHRVSRKKNGSKNKGEKNSSKFDINQNKGSNGLQKNNKSLPSDSDEDSDDVEHEHSQQYLKGQRERKGQSQRSRLEDQLRSSHFRFLNEKFYQCSGSDAYEMMTEDKAAFEVYHEGYSQQVQQWPVNPVNVFIKYLKSRPSHLVVGDFGCGEAQIAQSVKQKVHSFDLCAMNKHVTVCDIATVPLEEDSLDVAVFCLSLMGTNWIDYVKEANRVLKTGGVLKIAEVASRFQSLAAFVKVMKSLGFNSTSKDLTNKVFSLFDFTKQKPHRNIDVDKGDILKPCLYKKR